jgi:hypothetical protein
MYSPLTNITYEVDQVHNRTTHGSSPTAPCSPYYVNTPYSPGSSVSYGGAGVTPSPYSARPVYGPSMATPYQQFYDVATGAPLSFDEEQPEDPSHFRTPFATGQQLYMPMEEPRLASSASTCPCVYCTGAAVNVMPAQVDVTMAQGYAPMEMIPTPTRQSEPRHQNRGECRSDAADTQATPVRRQSTRKEQRSQQQVRSEPRVQPPVPVAISNTAPAAVNNQKFATPLPKSQQSGPEALSPASARRQPSTVNNSTAATTTTAPSTAAVYYVDVAGHHGRPRQVISYMALETGAHVVFEGDRGEDCGVVVRASLERDGHHAPTRNTPMVVRTATPDEVRFWNGPLAELGADAVRDCNEIIAKLGLALKVHSASFQLDKAKVTLFYECEQRVDFRRLLIEMFNKYRCRIWMERSQSKE